MLINFKRLREILTQTKGRPNIALLNPDETVVSSVGHYFDFNGKFKYNELSEISFVIPEYANGNKVPYYDQVVGGMLVKIDGAGIFILNNPSQEDTGKQKLKTCSAYSREFELSRKRVVFGAGTYQFWNPVTRTNTFLGMCFENIRGWSIGSVDASLYNKYRTFQDYSGDLLSLCLNTAQKSFGCVFEFDTENRIVNVRDANSSAYIAPIYLSFQNLLESNSINEIDDNLRTNISVYGAEGVDIRNVNPTGSNTIVNLGYALSQNQIPQDIANKYLSWKNEIIANQQSYTGLVALRNAASARYTVESAKLTDLKGELTSLDNLRDVNIQGKAMAQKEGPETEEGTVAYFEARLKEIARQYRDKEAEIQQQEELLDSIKVEYDGYVSDIQDINNRLKMSAYFSPSELDVLEAFMIDGDFTDSTFATFDVDISSSDDSYKNIASLKLNFTGSSVVDVNDNGGHRILMVSGGSVSIDGGDLSGSSNISNSIIEVREDGSILCSSYLGSGAIGEKEHPSGNMTVSGLSSVNIQDLLLSLEKHIESTVDKETGVSHDTVWYTGDFSLSITEAGFYFTRNVTEFQRYDVEQSLFDYANECIEEIAYPVFEFSIKSGNLLSDAAFQKFGDTLELGSSLYLQLSDTIRLTPVLLEVHVNFEDPSDFSLVFSNQFQTKRPDSVNSLKELLENSKNTSYTLDINKFEYSADRLSGATEAFDNFMKNGLNSAYQQVTAGSGQEVVIDGSGIKVKSNESQEFFTINNQMIALVDQKNETARMALGHFYSQEYETDYFGIVADVIFGTLLAGNGLSIACQDINDGSMLFEANSKGVQLHNGRFYIDHDRGGQIALDPTYGFAIGTNELYYFDENGRAVLNTDNANLYIDLEGNLHIKGTLDAVDGKFSGIVQATDFLDADGNSMLTKDGKFDSNYLDLGNIQLDGVTGDITMTGNLNLSELSSITWGNLSPVKYQFSETKNGPWHSTMSDSDYWRRDSLDGGLTWGSPYQFRGSTPELPPYIQWTKITSTTIESPTILAGEFYAVEDGKTYATMTNDSFALMRYNDDRPRALLNATDSDVTLVLGAGSNSVSEEEGRLYLTKAYLRGIGNAAALQYIKSDGLPIGIVMTDSGRMSFVADEISGLYLTFS